MSIYTKASLSVAALGTIVLHLLAAADPWVTWHDAVLISIGIWAMFAGQFVTRLLIKIYDP